MKKILFMPFLNLSSGHHQAADALIEWIHQIDPAIQCEKVDILHYRYGNFEKAVSEIYLKWIHHFPSTYSWLYQKLVCDKKKRWEPKRFFMYEMLFVKCMYNLILEKQPDMIVCTHALPSYLAQHLKRRGLLSIPVINVYTDYFINQVWGIQHIDYHFVPDDQLKQSLIARGVKEERIFVTGIPVHPKITKTTVKRISPSAPLSVLVTGGSLGAGLIKALIDKTRPGCTKQIQYWVLCGKNEKLYHELQQLQHPYLIPMPYIKCREKMNALYNQIHAIVTKPGGMTISESLYKALPIFIYHALPGQEEMNLKHLKKQGLVLHLEHWDHQGNLDQQLLSFLHSPLHQKELRNRIIAYQNQLQANIKDTLESIMEHQWISNRHLV